MEEIGNYQYYERRRKIQEEHDRNNRREVDKRQSKYQLDSEVEKNILETSERISKNMANQPVFLPQCEDSKRIVPNSFVRSSLFAAIKDEDRNYLEETTLFSQHGIKIIYTGFQLNQSHMNLWLTLINLAKEQALGTECIFTPYKILKTLNLSTGGEQYKKLHKLIVGLITPLIEVELKLDKGYKFYGGSLISSYRAEQFITDQGAKTYEVSLNKNLINLFGENDWTALDWEQRRRLANKPLALFLHSYYSSHFEPIPVSVDFIQTLSGSYNKEHCGFKQNLKNALNSLVKVDFLHNYSIDTGNKVTVKRTNTIMEVKKKTIILKNEPIEILKNEPIEVPFPELEEPDEPIEVPFPELEEPDY